MKTITNSIAMVIIATALLFTSCKKEAGPKGDTGPTGATGNSGPSATYVNLTANFDGTNAYVSYPLYTYAGWTTDDVVLTYFQSDYTSGAWYIQTPYLSNEATSSPVAYYFSEIATASLFIYAQKPSFSKYTPAFTVPTTRYFRIVIIKAHAFKAHPGININDYQEVKSVFNLKD